MPNLPLNVHDYSISNTLLLLKAFELLSLSINRKSFTSSELPSTTSKKKQPQNTGRHWEGFSPRFFLAPPREWVFNPDTQKISKAPNGSRERQRMRKIKPFRVSIRSFSDHSRDHRPFVVVVAVVVCFFMECIDVKVRFVCSNQQTLSLTAQKKKER